MAHELRAPDEGHGGMHTSMVSLPVRSFILRLSASSGGCQMLFQRVDVPDPVAAVLVEHWSISIRPSARSA